MNGDDRLWMESTYGLRLSSTSQVVPELAGWLRDLESSRRAGRLDSPAFPERASRRSEDSR